MKKLHSVYTPRSARKKSAVRKKLVPVQRPLTASAQTKAIRIGVWDLGAWVSYLEDVLKLWNDGQNAFRFQIVFLSVPPQLAAGGARSVEASKDYSPPKAEKHWESEIRDNVFLNELFPIASKIRKDLGYDLLVSITPLMLAFEDRKKLYYNYHSVSEDSIVFVSAYEIRDFAVKAKRPFEVAIGSMILGQMLADICNLKFHPETRGCLFDFNEKRYTIVESFKELQIEPACLAKIKPDLRASAQKMLRILDSYKRS